MIVLDHRGIPQAHAVIGRPAHARRIFFEHPKPRNGLARVEQGRAGAGNGIDIGGGERGDARQMLDGVERRALGRQHRPRRTGQPHQRRASRHARAVARQQLDADIGIKRAEKRRRHIQPGNRDRIAARHRADKPRRSRDDGGRGNVPARAQILGQGRRNERGQIKPARHCHCRRLSQGPGAAAPDRPTRRSRSPSRASGRGCAWPSGAVPRPARCAAPGRAARCRAFPSC